MFLLKPKIDPALKDAINKKYYKKLRVLVKYKAQMHIKVMEKKIKACNGSIIYSLPIISCIVCRITPDGIKRLLEYPQIEYISYDDTAVLCGNGIMSSNGIGSNYNFSLTGKNICIGLIDSGTYPHADLLSPRNKIIKFLDLINSYQYPYDDNGHGTFISGLLCGNGSLSKGMYRGVSPDASIYSIKAFNSIGNGQISDILFSLAALISEAENFNIRVICMPFETKCHAPFIESLFSKLFALASDKGIIVVVPSGHNGEDEGSIMGIATLENCITVSGVDTTQSKTCAFKLSSKGPFGKSDKPDLSAAAVNISSLNADINFIPERNGAKLYPKGLDIPYTTYNGTSCAAAFIAGLCALLIENNPELSFKDVLSLLKVSCNIQNLSKWAQGAGTVNINKLLP